MRPVMRMVTILLVLAAMLFACFVHAETTVTDGQGTAEWWDNLAVIQVNTEKPHAHMMTYANASQALTFDRTHSPWFLSLNGEWRFHWAENPVTRPVDFYRTDFDDSRWVKIPVPSNWQIHGFGTPIYRNATYPFPKNPPHAPRIYNPVGSYRRTFELPAGWQGRETFLHFAGVNSAAYVWVNGQLVGYSEDSRTPMEFNITKYLKTGVNQLAVEVYRWCDGSYLEDQDFWRLSGIYRDVFLWSRAKTHIRDFQVKTDLDADYRDATLGVNVELAGEATGYSVDARLLDARGKAVLNGTITLPDTSLSQKVTNPLKWNAEYPNLYRLLLTLRDPHGKTVEVIPLRVGFRKVEIKDGIFLVNGVPVKLKGVNRHEHDPDTAQYNSRETMLRDIRMFKEFNINALRMCHYPNDPQMYELCDIYGIYVMDEANIECHGARELSGKPEWEPLHMNRLQRMVERDKNFPCIIIWSLGNESGRGIGPQSMYAWLHQRDASRPVHCEYANENADMVSHMYAGEGWVDSGSKPSVLCEYTHAMGNSNGNLSEYWHDNIYKNAKHMGGFVWDWVDQGIRQPVPAEFKANIGKGPVKETFLAYGGWFPNSGPNDNFNMNGLVSADRVPHPGLYALKYVYRNIHVTPINLAQGTFKVTNWFDFSNLEDVADGTWKVETLGKVVARGKIPPLNVPARQSVTFSLPLPSIPQADLADSYLTLSFTAKADYSSLIQVGHELAWEQFPLQVRTVNTTMETRDTTHLPTLHVERTEQSITVLGRDFCVSFDAHDGRLTSYTVKDVPLMRGGPTPNFWRALTNNDKGCGVKFSDKKWKTAGDSWKTGAPVVEQLADNAIRITRSGVLESVGGMFTVSQTVFGDGTIDIEASYTPGTDGPHNGPLRQGLIFTLPGGFERVDYLGRGPAETYVDRKFERIGRYQITVDGLWCDYSQPQENGNRTDVRYVALTNDKGAGLLFAGLPTFGYVARHYAQDAISTWYSFQMKRSEDIYVDIDYAQAGVGGNNSWGATPLGKYCLTNAAFSYRFRIIPLLPGVDAGQVFKAKQ